MAAAGKLRYVYLTLLSKPREDRQLYRLAKRLRATKIVELGVGSLERSLNLISVCQRYSPEAKISFTGLDWFEERPAGCEPLSLIQTHRKLTAAGAAPRLMPGGPAAAFPAVANSLLGADLVLISAEADDEALAPSWFFLPRILHERSIVLRASHSGEAPSRWVEIPRGEIKARAPAPADRRAA